MALPRPLLPVASSSSSAAAAAAAAESSSSPLSPPHEPDSSPRRLAQRPQPARPTRNDDKDDDEDDGQTGWRNRGGIRLVGSYRGDEEDREGSPVNASGTITNDDEQQEEEDKSSHLLPAPTPTPTPSISISSAPPRTGSTSSASVPPPPSSPTGMTRTGGYDDDDDDNQDRKGRRPSFSSSASSSVGTAASSTPIVDPRAAPAAIGTVSHDDGHPTALRTKKNRFRRSSKTKNQRKGPPRPPAASSSSSSSSDLLVPIGTSTHPLGDNDDDERQQQQESEAAYYYSSLAQQRIHLMPTPTTTTMTNNNGVADQNPASPPMKARGSFAAVTSGPPKRRGSGGSSSSAGPRPGLMGGGRPSSSSSSSSPLKKASSSSAVTSTSTASGSGNPTGRFGPFDRMLDRAVQYFLDTDSHADRCEDEIWLLGVRHAGWDPEAVEEGAERPTMATRAAAAAAAAGEAGGGNGGAGGKAEGGRRGGLAGLVARRASPVKARKTQQQKSGQPSPQPMVAAATTASGDDPFVNVSSSAAASDPPAPVTGAHAAVGTATTSSSATATRIHGWPATFYRDFYSRVGLTYRSDFPLIECDPPPASPYGGGGVVHGMLSNLSMSLGRGAQRLAGNVGAGAGENSGEEKMQAAAVVKGLSSDTGWGCMLRTGQSLLANALVKIHLGRDWRRPLSSSPDAIPQAATYARILSLFLDDPSPLSPFSVHQFARQGKQLGKEIGEWFGPSTAAGAIKALVNAYEPAGLRVVSCIDGTVYESEVVEASTVEGTSWKRPVLVLVNVRLGLEGVNPVYHDSIKSVFRFPQSVGIAGGRPISSYYFVGAQADSLFYIDPHFPRPAVPLVLPSDPELVEAFAHVPVRATGRTPSSSSSASPVDRAAIRNGKDSSTHTADQIAHFLLSAYPDSVWATYHCDKVRKVSLSSLDPSMLIGFVVENASDWLDFRNRVQELAQSSAPMFTVAPSPPAWLRRSASATTAVRTASAGARNSLDDSFSVIGESRAGGDNDDNDDNDGFSEPEDWELQSTDDEGLRSSVLVERSTPPAQAAISRSPDDAVLL
ncbi:hypothetical protein B0A53_05012 [Rhodotorula sp. CCFEE 5036]|nr:hypothetical protein B0A53_05012 [Rhodotorula sp. CCFEE 5036]